MSLLILFAFLAGIVTILSPCILPVLPVVLSGSAGGGKARPLGIISGFILSFTAFSLTLATLVQLLGISADILRWIAAGLILGFGLVMVVPPLKQGFTNLASRLASKGSPKGQSKSTGFWSGLILGLSLGLVWAPCTGPIMASVLTLAATSAVDLGSVFIALAYSAGTAVPLFLIMLGGRTLLVKFPFFSRNTERIQKGFGILMVITALAIFSGFDRKFQTAMLSFFPNYGKGLTAIEDQKFIEQALEQRRDKSVAGEYTKELGSLYEALALGGMWINSPPLDPASLKGKVVLIDFWTYSCINCIRTLPYLTAWDERYRDQGLVIIGVHAPEFAFEKSSENVGKAVKDLGIAYAVVQDNDFKIWKAFENHYWPAHYFFDRNGKLVYQHFGEGEYKKSEMLIQTLLGKNPDVLVSSKISDTESHATGLTAETYLGYERSQDFASPQLILPDTKEVYTIPVELEKNHWALAGSWIIHGESVETADQNAELELIFHAAHVYLVLGPGQDTKGIIPQLTITVDGQKTNTKDVKEGILKLDGYRLYELYSSDKAVTGRLKLTITGYLNAYAFTFG